MNIVKWLSSWLRGTAQADKADWDTVGPDEDEHPIVYAGTVDKANWGEVNRGEAKEKSLLSPAWTSGWYYDADETPAHPGRIGPTIVPATVVVHTTDMHPSSHDALVKAWRETRGGGNAAHFLIGRTPEQGIKQFAQITRNANHAGGAKHGWWRTAEGKFIHPNTVAVGIELDNAGRLQKRGKAWVHPDSGKTIPLEEVYIDAKGVGWHVLTPYQYGALMQLLHDLKACLVPLPPGCVISPNGSYLGNGVPWAVMSGVDVVGHATLDPTNKTDPGPQVTAWLEENV